MKTDIIFTYSEIRTLSDILFTTDDDEFINLYDSVSNYFKKIKEHSKIYSEHFNILLEKVSKYKSLVISYSNIHTIHGHIDNIIGINTNRYISDYQEKCNNINIIKLLNKLFLRQVETDVGENLRSTFLNSENNKKEIIILKHYENHYMDGYLTDVGMYVGLKERYISPVTETTYNNFLKIYNKNIKEFFKRNELMDVLDEGEKRND